MNFLKTYNFRMPRNILFGINASEQVGQKAKELGQNGLEVYRDKNISWDNVVTKLLGDK